MPAFILDTILLVLIGLPWTTVCNNIIVIPLYINDFSEKQRVPAWCDRILWKVQQDLPGLAVKKHMYKSPAYAKGDHKPVVASFDVNVSTIKNL